MYNYITVNNIPNVPCSKLVVCYSQSPFSRKRIPRNLPPVNYTEDNSTVRSRILSVCVKILKRHYGQMTSSLFYVYLRCIFKVTYSIIV